MFTACHEVLAIDIKPLEDLDAFKMYIKLKCHRFSKIIRVCLRSI